MIHRRIGAGVHSEVYHRPGSQVVLQVFRPDCPELTVERLQDEYRYLRRVYASSLPALVPWQQLRQFGPRLQDCVLVKDYVPHRERPWLHHCDPDQLAEHSRHQLQQFVLVTRQLLAAVPDSHGDQVRFPTSSTTTLPTSSSTRPARSGWSTPTGSSPPANSPRSTGTPCPWTRIRSTRSCCGG